MGATLEYAALSGRCLLERIDDMLVLSRLVDEVPRAVANLIVQLEIRVLPLDDDVLDGLLPSLFELFGRAEDPCGHSCSFQRSLRVS